MEKKEKDRIELAIATVQLRRNQLMLALSACPLCIELDCNCCDCPVRRKHLETGIINCKSYMNSVLKIVNALTTLENFLHDRLSESA